MKETNFTKAILFNNVDYKITLEPIHTKGQITVIVQFNNETIWVSINITPLENRYFSYKQLNFNYNNYIFTRNSDKKNNEKDILYSRNIDRSIRPYIPEHFPYNISIECWNLSVGEEDPTIPIILGINGGMMSLGLLKNSILPVLMKNNYYFSATICNKLLSNLELSSSGVSIDNLCNNINEYIHKYDEYNNFFIENFNGNNYMKLLNNMADQDVYNIKNILVSIKSFMDNYEVFQKNLENITNIIIDRVNDRVIDQFTHGFWDKHIDKWIIDQLDVTNIKIGGYFTEQIFIEVKKTLFCNNLIKTKIRYDGRKFQDSREIILESCGLNNFHNSLMVVKGKTRLLIGGYFIPQDRNYDHKIHVKYIFNPFINPKRTSNRREIGHGNLIEKAINKVINDNPWKAFFNCYITNSDGSSSMLSVIGCGLMVDKFQWNLKKVSGISIGLVENNHNNHLLVDICENEDFYCSMDMKIISTKDGIIGCQLDVKNHGISLDLLKKALELGQKKNNKIIKDLYRGNLENITSNYYNNSQKIPITIKNYLETTKLS